MLARRAVALVALAGLGVSIGSVLFLAGGDGNGDEDELDLEPATTLDRDALTEEGRELLDLAEAGQDETYHVLYRVPEPESGDLLATATTEIWQRGDQIRLESVVTDSTGTARRIDIAVADGTVVCDELPGSPLSCELHRGVPPPRPIEEVLAVVLGRLQSSELTAEDAMIGSVPARCFTLEGEDSGRVCLDRDGILVFYDDGESRIEAISVDRSVPDDIFVPPGASVPPAEVPSTTSG